MILYSLAFTHNGQIPTKYTCDGEDISPSLEWSEVPEKTRSFVLMVDDPDAPSGTWNHWLLYDIPGDVCSITENCSAGIEGTTSLKKLGYHGACPPSGERRYIFTLYALDTRLDILPAANKAQIEKAIEGHVLEQAELVGRYERTKK